jgi:hypothetical protein
MTESENHKHQILLLVCILAVGFLSVWAVRDGKISSQTLVIFWIMILLCIPWLYRVAGKFWFKSKR